MWSQVQMEEETTRLLVGSQATLGKAVHDRKVLEIHNRFLPLVPIGAIIGARVLTDNAVEGTGRGSKPGAHGLCRQRRTGLGLLFESCRAWLSLIRQRCCAQACAALKGKGLGTACTLPCIVWCNMCRLSCCVTTGLQWRDTLCLRCNTLHEVATPCTLLQPAATDRRLHFGDSR